MSITLLQARVRGAIARRDHTDCLIDAMKAPPVSKYLSSLLPRELELDAAIRHLLFNLCTGEVRFQWNTTLIHSSSSMAMRLSKIATFRSDKQGYHVDILPI